MFNNFLCADSLITSLFVVDGLLILGALGLIIWYFVKNKNKSAGQPNQNKEMSKLDDETYLVDGEAQEEVVPAKEDNEVVHFVNQISDISEEVNNEMTSNAVVVTHEVEAPVKKIVKKEEITNFVEVAGEKKVKTEEEIAASVNRGTNSFKNATDFVNVIKSEQFSDSLSSKKVVKKK